MKYLLALVVVAVIGIGVLVLLHERPQLTAGRVAPVVAVPAAPLPAATPPTGAAQESACLLPGPAPVPPNGETASAADMQLGHDVMQAFVNELEAYQACRNNQIDHPAPGTTPAQKQTWIDEGNAAVDEANALAVAFSTQLKAFKAQKHPH